MTGRCPLFNWTKGQGIEVPDSRMLLSGVLSFTSVHRQHE
jgi:hypothetical protein